MSKIVAIVQARMGSSRLPGKVLMDIAGKSVLAHCIERLARAGRIDEIVVATTEHAEDMAIHEAATALGAKTFAGSESDVLNRYRAAAEWAKADIVVRVTSDCPLIDPEITDNVIEAYLESEVDLASNVIRRTFPRGVDTEVLSVDMLRYLDGFVKKPEEREHVTMHLYQNQEQFWLASVETEGPMHRPELRFCVDTEADLDFMRTVFKKIDAADNLFPIFEAVKLIEREPKLADINAHVEQVS